MEIKPTYSPTIKIVIEYGNYNGYKYENNNKFIEDEGQFDNINYKLHIKNLYSISKSLIISIWDKSEMMEYPIIKNYFTYLEKCQNNFKINKDTIKDIVIAYEDKKPFKEFINDMRKINNSKELNILYGLFCYFLKMLNLCYDYYIETIIYMIVISRYIYYILNCQKKYSGIMDYFIYLKKE